MSLPELGMALNVSYPAHETALAVGAGSSRLAHSGMDEGNRHLAPDALAAGKARCPEALFRRPDAAGAALRGDPSRSHQRLAPKKAARHRPPFSLCFSR